MILPRRSTCGMPCRVIALAGAAIVALAALPAASAAPQASVVQGTFAVTGSLTVHNSYDSTADCEDGVSSQQAVTLHVALKPSRIIIASALGAAAGTVHGASSSVTVEQNAFRTTSRCDGSSELPPTRPVCEPAQGKAMVMLTQNPPQGTLTPVPLDEPRLTLVVAASDAKGGVRDDCARYWPVFGAGPNGDESLSLGTTPMWSFNLPSGLQMQGRNGLAGMKKGARKQWVTNVTGPCDGFSGTASPRSGAAIAVPTGDPVRSCEMTGRFLLTFTRR